MDTTEPRGSDAEIVALLRACGMDEANLDDGVRNVRKIVDAKTAAASGTRARELARLADFTREMQDAQDRQEAQIVAAARAGATVRQLAASGQRSQHYVMKIVHASGLVHRSGYEEESHD